MLILCIPPWKKKNIPVYSILGQLEDQKRHVSATQNTPQTPYS